jgi:hypothetical protein
MMCTGQHVGQVGRAVYEGSYQHLDVGQLYPDYLFTLEQHEGRIVPRSQLKGKPTVQISHVS